jgi:hypothetical protein
MAAAAACSVVPFQLLDAQPGGAARCYAIATEVAPTKIKSRPVCSFLRTAVEMV